MATNQLFSVGLYIVLGIGAATAAYGYLLTRSFLATYTAIDTQQDLEEFKRLVKTNMYLALAMMAVAATAVALGAIGLALGSIGWIELRLVLFIMGPLCGIAGVALTAAEGRLKKVSVSDESLRIEFDATVKRWTSNALPDW